MVRIHGVKREVKARIAQIHGLSAHADQAGLLEWVTNLNDPPRRVFLTHGEEDAATALADRINTHWPDTAHVPQYQETVELA